MSGRLPNVYLRLNQRLTHLFQLIRGLVDGLWLGSASADLLHGIDEAFYATQKQYLSEEYTRSGLKDWERQAVEKHFGSCRNVVVTGAGGGREVLALAGEGRTVTGLEPNQEMVNFGRRVIGDRKDVILMLAPRDGWPDITDSFDGAIIGWGSYTHIVGREHRIDFLRRLRKHLLPGSPVLLSVYDRPRTSLYHRTVYRVGRPLRALRRAERIDFGDGFAPMYAHHFLREELAEELSEGGFTLLHWRRDPFAHAVAVADAVTP